MGVKLNRPNRLIATVAAVTGLAALAAAYNYYWYWTGDVFRTSYSNNLVSFGRSKTITTSSGPAYFEFVTAASQSGYNSGVVVQAVNLNTGAVVYNQFFQAYGGSNAYYNGYIPVSVGTYSVTFYARSNQPSSSSNQVILGNTYVYWY